MTQWKDSCLFAFSILSLGALGCASRPCAEPGTVYLAPPDSANFTLHVSNQSGPRDKVDIEVLIDGKTTVKDRFCHDDGHRWTTYVLRLDPGDHALTAVTAEGEAAHSEKLRIEGAGAKYWASLDYWYSPGGKWGTEVPARFTLVIQQTPITFR